MWGSGITRCGDLVRVTTSVRRFAPAGAGSLDRWRQSLSPIVERPNTPRAWLPQFTPRALVTSEGSSENGKPTKQTDARGGCRSTRSGSRPQRAHVTSGCTRHDRSRAQGPAADPRPSRLRSGEQAPADHLPANTRSGNGACMRSTAGSIDPVRVARVDEETEGRCPSDSERAVSARIMNRTGYCSNE